MTRAFLEELSESGVEKIMQKVNARSSQQIPPGLKKEIAALARVAVRGIQSADRRVEAQYNGKYKECYPEIAQGICRVFHAEDDELAACFGVSESTLYQWRHKHRAFAVAIRVGKSVFRRCSSWNTQYRAWLHPHLVRSISRVFKATTQDLAACLGVSLKTLYAWRYGHLEFIVAVDQVRRFEAGIQDTGDGTCVQCGRCCLKYGNCLQATDEDIKRWEDEGRADILAWMHPSGDLWINRETGEEAARCPWVRKVPAKWLDKARGQQKYVCRIHETKPQACRNYPVTREQALKDECPRVSLEYVDAKSEKAKTSEQRENPPDRQPAQE